MSKPVFVTWPFVLLLLDYWPLHRLGWRPTKAELPRAVDVLKEKIPFFILTVLSCWITVRAQTSVGAVVSLETYSLKARFLDAVSAYGSYFEKFFLPIDLIIPYRTTWTQSETAGLVFSFLLLVGMTSAILWFCTGHKVWAVGWFWFLGTLIPVIGLVQVGGQFIADRYTYLPSTGLALLLVFGGEEILSRWRLGKTIGVVACMAALAVLVFLSNQRLTYWKNGETLFRETLRLDPENLNAAGSLAWTYATDLDPRLRNGPKAVRLAEICVAATNRKAPWNLLILAAAYAEAGDVQRALRTVNEARSLPATETWEGFQGYVQWQLNAYTHGKPLRDDAVNRKEAQYP